MVLIKDLIAALEAFAPNSRAADWDNVGLLLGDAAGPVQRVMTCLTVTPESVREAIEQQVQLIVSHHPIFFRPIKSLTSATAEGRMLLDLVRAGVAVYSPHTAFDNCAGGINDLIAERLGLTNVGPLRTDAGAGKCKLVVFVPEADLGKVSDALFAAGAGRIGQYRECSFRLSGLGTFFGSDDANPTIGVKGRREEVAEWRLEVVCPEECVDRVVAAMRKAHSYEEPAYDIYPLRREPGRTGEGRVGMLAQAMALGEFAQRARKAVSSSGVQIVGASTASVQRVAIVCGSGGAYLTDAAAAGADVLVTGEARFQDCLAAQAQRVALVLPGHYATERCGIEMLATRLQAQFPALSIWPCRLERDPLSFV